MIKTLLTAAVALTAAQAEAATRSTVRCHRSRHPVPSSRCAGESPATGHSS